MYVYNNVDAYRTLFLNVAVNNNAGGGGLSALLPLDLLCPFDPLLTPHCSTHSESYHQSACSTNSVYYCKCSNCDASLCPCTHIYYITVILLY